MRYVHFTSLPFQCTPFMSVDLTFHLSFSFFFIIVVIIDKLIRTRSSHLHCRKFIAWICHDQFFFFAALFRIERLAVLQKLLKQERQKERKMEEEDIDIDTSNNQPLWMHGLLFIQLWLDQWFGHYSLSKIQSSYFEWLNGNHKLYQ